MYFCGDPIKQMCGCLPSPQYSVPNITADNSMCDTMFVTSNPYEVTSKCILRQPKVRLPINVSQVIYQALIYGVGTAGVH
jgi:hypothetical protein